MGTRAAARPIRFCLLSTFYPPWSFGGDGTQVQRLARALAERGHSVTVVCSPPAHRMLSGTQVPPPPPDDAGVEVVPLEGGPASLLGRYVSGRPVGAGRQLSELLGRSFDVLHFHNPSLLGAPGLLEMEDGPVKLYTAHEQWLLCPGHVLWKRIGGVCENPPCWSCEIAHGRPPQPWRRTGLLRRCLEHLDALIAPSRTSAELHSRFEDTVQVEVIPHFAPPVESDGSGSQGGGRPLFLFAGRLEPIKGVDTLVEAFRRRDSEDLVIAGEGSMARRLRRQARGIDNIRFAGRLSRDSLDGLYRDATAVVIPTRGHEAMPLVFLEAMAHGTPAVVRRFGVLDELTEGTGAALSYGSVAELDQALDRIASDATVRAELGERGLAAARGTFSLGSHMARYMSLIADIARRRGDSGLAEAAEAATSGDRAEVSR